jgi:hypothetical protein
MPTPELGGDDFVPISARTAFPKVRRGIYALALGGIASARSFATNALMTTAMVATLKQQASNLLQERKQQRHLRMGCFLLDARLTHTISIREERGMGRRAQTRMHQRPFR